MRERAQSSVALGPSVLASGRSRTKLDPHHLYLCLLSIVLAGYATMGKGFAYLGYPPLFIGEVTLVLGLLVMYRAGCVWAMLASSPSVLLAVLVLLIAVKACLGVESYGLDAVRDGMIVIYGLYAFIVVTLLIEKPERLRWVLRHYSGFAWAYGLLGGLIYYVTVMAYAPLVYVRAGEAAVHLAGATVFSLLGLRKVSPLWVLLVIVGITMVSPNRGAMLACCVPIGIAAIMGGNLRRFGLVLLFALALFLVAYAAGLNVQMPGGRTFGPEQIINNIESIAGSNDTSNLDGTKEWRLRWWKAIVDYTVNGPYFWTGKGFGMGLAEADGFVVGMELGGPMVRSPHNGHLTLLARAGVPALVLWLCVLFAWFGMLLRNILAARNRGDTQWAGVFVWIACYAGSILIDASFDVALEGPMIGIWFWSLFGLGIGASMIYRHEVVSQRFSAWNPA